MKPVVAILCGGRGARLTGHTQTVPKPLVEVGGRPIVWHVVRLYAAQGFTRFFLLTGHRGGEVEAFARTDPWPEGVEVRCLDTGPDTPTGGRLHRAAPALGAGTVCVTYADGVADLDLDALLAYHRGHGAPATVTVVRPVLQFGVAELGGDGIVTAFREKPRSEQWVNGGFLCLEPAALAALDADSVLERDALQRLAAAGQLRAFRHEGFWACMDTYKDAAWLDELWTQGRAPWKLWR